MCKRGVPWNPLWIRHWRWSDRRNCPRVKTQVWKIDVDWSTEDPIRVDKRGSCESNTLAYKFPLLKPLTGCKNCVEGPKRENFTPQKIFTQIILNGKKLSIYGMNINIYWNLPSFVDSATLQYIIIRKYGSTSYVGISRVQNGRLYLIRKYTVVLSM